MSLETILPFLQPIAHLIVDAGVSEVMVNGNGAIFIQRNGELSAVDAALDPKYLANAVKRIARSLGNDIGESKPLLDTRLPDGSRVAAAFPPCSLHGVTLTIRKVRPHWFTMGDHRNGRNGPFRSMRSQPHLGNLRIDAALDPVRVRVTLAQMLRDIAQGDCTQSLCSRYFRFFC